jgi:hypothetical protein
VLSHGCSIWKINPTPSRFLVLTAKDIGQELSQVITNPFNAQGSPGLSPLRIAERLWLTMAIMHNAFSRVAALPS